jgi:hypothetical protein
MSDEPSGEVIRGTPLEFTVSVQLPHELPLDEVVYTSRIVANWGRVFHYGVVDHVEMTSSVDYQARIRVLRIEPELFVPPQPGSQVFRADAKVQELALRFQEMPRRLVAGMLNDGQPAYFNLDFLNGAKGAHVNIAGISGVATKTSYALFLLYSLFQSHPQSRAIVFNVKGDDLLYLDRPNARLTAHQRGIYERLQLPCAPFPEVAYHAREGGLWTLREFAERELVRFLFNDDDQTENQEIAIDRLAEVLRQATLDHPGPDLVIQQTRIESMTQLCDMICNSIDEPKSLWFEKAAANTRQSIVRRLRGIAPQVAPLLRDGPGKSFDYAQQLNVVDLHLYSEKARAFVLGGVLKALFDGRQAQGDAHPTVYLLLDELNKYAPQHKTGPIKQMLLDVAERGRSLGIILLGAQQTASEVEERVVGNAALRVAGRLETAESTKETYGWLTGSLRPRSILLQPGSMIISQPDVPVPLVIRFPFPAWATRSNEVKS